MGTSRADVIRIFMERDGMTETEARDYLRETMDVVNEAIECGDDAESEWEEMTGLEPDYLIDCCLN